MGTVYLSQKQIHFQDFVEGIAYCFATNSISSNDAKILVQKASDPNNFETMTSILDSVFFSHSKISRAVLGIITGKFMSDDKLDYDDMVLVSALKNVFDEDLKQFGQFSKYKTISPNDRTAVAEQYSATDRLILERLQAEGILGRDLAGNRLGGPALRFELTSVSIRLRSYLEAVSSIFTDE